nr:RNA polymerase sigma factor [uncultured Blautia sp.]
MLGEDRYSEKNEYFKTWLTRILINHCNTIHRQRKRLVSDESLPEAWSQDESYADVEWKDFLNGLEEKYRIVVLLYYVEGFKTREIAEILEMNQSTVRGRLVTAREKLGQQYDMGGAPSRNTPDVKKKAVHCGLERGI